MSNRKLLEAAKLLLIGVKNGDIVIYPNSDTTPNYLQNLENAVKEVDAMCQHVWGEERHGVCKCNKCGKFNC